MRRLLLPIRVVSLLGVVALAACTAVPPSSIVQQPTSARAQAAPALSPPENGSIFQSASFRPLFEDRRARLVGDTLTIAVSEKASANKNNAGLADRKGKLDSTVGQLSVLPASAGNRLLTLQGGGSSKFESKDAGSASYNFVSTIGVMVTEVLPNGNLVVSGEKQIGLDQGTEFVRFSGIVTPDSIGPGNIVPSTQVADARVEYRTNTQIDQSQFASMMNRIFLNVLPF